MRNVNVASVSKFYTSFCTENEVHTLIVNRTKKENNEIKKNNNKIIQHHSKFHIVIFKTHN